MNQAVESFRINVGQEGVGDEEVPLPYSTTAIIAFVAAAVLQLIVRREGEDGQGLFVLKISMAVVFGLVFGVAIGLIGIGGANVSFSPEVVGMLGRYAWWIVFLSMLVPLADYLSGVRTTLTGVLFGHPFRHVAGFFTGLAVGLAFLLLLASILF
ncbi:MAG: hypothetical protein ABSF00_06935 [Candidatus Bathyarchaeia archaeon]|jgi:hypothetical protein